MMENWDNTKNKVRINLLVEHEPFTNLLFKFSAIEVTLHFKIISQQPATVMSANPFKPNYLNQSQRSLTDSADVCFVTKGQNHKPDVFKTVALTSRML